MPRTSPPFAGIRRLPINPALSAPSDAIGSLRERNALPGCSSPCCDLMSPEPAAFLQPLTPLAVYLSLPWECEIGKQRFPPRCFLALHTKAVAMYSFYWGTRCTYVLNHSKLNCGQGTGMEGGRGDPASEKTLKHKRHGVSIPRYW